jgi:formylglycine-generating enzyme required for sulfatase activity
LETAEIEWEYLARGIDNRIFPWGDGTEIGERIKERLGGKSLSVGSIPEDRTPFGVIGMGGNVSEWIAETWYPYRNSPLGTLEKVEEEYGIIRGGNYLSETYQMRTTYRERRSRLDDTSPIGFRCAK